MKFRVVSGDLNVIVNHPMWFEKLTQKHLIDVIREALDKCKKDTLEFGELLRVCECPLTSPHNCYFIETKSALEQAGFKIHKHEMR